MSSNACTGSTPVLGTFFRCVLCPTFTFCNPRLLRFYIGYSEAPDRRLTQHNSGKVKSTRNFRPWKKIYQEEFETEIPDEDAEKIITIKDAVNYIVDRIEKEAKAS